MSLVACTSCRRHVRSGDASCPFCGAAVRVAANASATRFPLRIAGAFALAASVGCSTSSTAMYGAPAPPDTGATEAATDAASTTDTAVEDTGAAGTLYGAPAPPEDTGAD